MFRKITLTFLVLVFLFGCSRDSDQSDNASPKSSSPPKEPVKIGYALPLSGGAVTYTEVQKKAVELALSEINAGGGIRGRQLDMLYEESKLNPSVAVTAMKKLIDVDKVPVVFGFSSGEVLAMAPTAERSQTVIIAPLASTAEISKAGSFVFRISPSDALQGEVLGEVIYKDNLARAAVLFVNNDWGAGLKEGFSKKFQSLGGSVVAAEGSNPGDRDFRTQLVKLRESGADNLVLLLHPQELVHAIRQLRELGVKLPVYGGDTFSADLIYQTISTLLEGVVFTLPAKPSSAAFQKFAAKYEVNYGVKPDVNAAACYDAVKLVATVMNEVGTASTDIRTALAKTSNFKGASGDITFDENGDIVSKVFDVLVIRDGRYQKREAL